MLKKKLLVDSAGNIYKRGCSDSAVDVPIDTDKMDFKRARLSMKTGSLNIRFNIEFAIMTRPRPPLQHCFYSLEVLYKKLELTCYKNWPSKWVHDRFGAWKGFHRMNAIS